MLKLRPNERLNPVTRLRNIESQVCKKCFDKQVVYRIAKYRYNYISVVIIVARMPQERANICMNKCRQTEKKLTSDVSLPCGGRRSKLTIHIALDFPSCRVFFYRLT